MDSKFADHLAAIQSNGLVSNRSRRVARAYTRAEVANEINDALREQRPMTSRGRAVMRALDACFDGVGPTAIEGVLWRAIRGRTLDYPRPGLYLGEQRGFTSTTLSRKYAEELLDEAGSGDLWRIDLRAPSKVIDVNRLIGSYSRFETEVLLPRGSTFKLLSIQRKLRATPGKIVRVEVWARNRPTS